MKGINMKQLLLGSLLALVFSSPFAKNDCSNTDTQSIQSAIKKYLSMNTAISPYQITIDNLHCEESYAAAKITPQNKATDTATVYLKLVKGEWNVLSLGTDFDETFLKTIPKALRDRDLIK